jgi:cellobiose phosphorylase
VTADYIENTGSSDILSMEVPYIEDEPLDTEHDERYSVPRKSKEKTTVYIHCIRSIERALKFGEHGIPLMGSGDWNDGMNTVGNKGKGESIWLGWFIYTILNRFTPICIQMKEKDRAKRYEKIARQIMESIENNAWDGGWYLRAYFDDGTPLGSAQNSECKIDSLAQTWAVISGAGRIERVKEAMEALEHYLVKRDEGLVLLLTPPFDKGNLKPGYIKGYVPGVRENGGQYTHAAVWVALAYAKLGMGDKATEIFSMINPINHARTSMEAARYKVEPYVVAADIYEVHPNTGRGGWTWYTGASGWMYRVGIEHILGFNKKGNKLKIEPCIPKAWHEYSIAYKYIDTIYDIKVMNPDGINGEIKNFTVDGKSIREKEIRLVNDKKRHEVIVVLG